MSYDADKITDNNNNRNNVIGDATEYIMTMVRELTIMFLHRVAEIELSDK